MRLFVLTFLIVFMLINSSSPMKILCKIQTGYSTNKCNAKDVVTKYDDRNITGIVGNYGGVDIHELIITYSDIPYLPLNISENFPIIKYLKIHKSNVQYLMTGDLSGLYKLENLDLSNNPIDQIGEDFFKHLSSLTTINFNECHLKKIAYNAFAPLVNLKIASFEKNECIDMKVLGSIYGPTISELKRNIIEKCANTTHTLKTSYQETCDENTPELKSSESSHNVSIIVGVILMSAITGALSAMLIYMQKKVSSGSWKELRRQTSEN